MSKSYIYGYFSIKDFEYSDFNDKTNEKRDFKFEKGDCIYIGISTNTVHERHTNHMKKSKYDGKEGQVINRLLQDNQDAWEILTLQTIESHLNDDKFNKKIIHSNEIMWIKEFEPTVNIYGVR